MKTFKFLFPISIIILAITSCEEVGPPIDFTQPVEGVIDTTFVGTPESPQAKVALMEDFTGVQCVNCSADGRHTITIGLLAWWFARR